MPSMLPLEHVATSFGYDFALPSPQTEVA